jgi:hypothetical protein
VRRIQHERRDAVDSAGGDLGGPGPPRRSVWGRRSGPIETLAAIISEAKGKSPMVQEIGHAARRKDQGGKTK